MATQASAPRTGGGVGTVGTPTLWAIAAINLAWVSGILGSFFEEAGDAQTILWSLASMGGLTGASLLAVRHLRAGRDLAAAGFAAFAIVSAAEGVLGFSGEGNTGVSVSMAILHLPVGLLIASQDWSAIWARGAVALSGVLFAIYGYQYWLGDQTELPDVDSPLAIAGYITLTIAIIGWTMTLMAEDESG